MSWTWDSLLTLGLDLDLDAPVTLRMLVIVVAVGALGFIVHFAWHWWLLSRPDVRH